MEYIEFMTAEECYSGVVKVDLDTQEGEIICIHLDGSFAVGKIKINHERFIDGWIVTPNDTPATEGDWKLYKDSITKDIHSLGEWISQNPLTIQTGYFNSPSDWLIELLKPETENYIKVRFDNTHDFPYLEYQKITEPDDPEMYGLIRQNLITISDQLKGYK